MGPNGSGKSTLSATLAGRDEYEVDEGSITFKNKDLLELEPEERAGEGICSKLIANNFCASTANSSGNSENTSLQNPFTIIEIASSSLNPR
mgnify:CR=1 FL=1